MSLNYDSDDAVPRSPGLEVFKPRATPSPSPPPVVTHQVTISSTAQSVSPPSSRRRKKSNRRKTRPSQGDFVLIRVMDPNRPDIAREVGQRALNSDSGSEAEDEDMEEPPPPAEAARSEPASSQTKSSDPSYDPSSDLQKFAQEALDTNVNSATAPTITKLPPPFSDHRDSVVEPDTQDRETLNADISASQTPSTSTLANGVPPGAAEADAKSPATISASTTQATSPNLTAERHGSIVNSYPNQNSLATSPNLRELTIPPPRGGSPSQKLPALQTPQSPPREGSASSPSQNQQLPSFRHLSELAETAINEQEINRVNNYPHRQSISSTGQSPTSIGRQLSITSLSPGGAFPLSATSPSGSSDIQSRDPFLRSGQSHLTLFSTRRPSQASEGGPYSATIHSATTNDSYQSSDGLSPGTQPTSIDSRGPRMSIDGALTSRTLPPPVGPNIQHIPSHGSGGFKCDYPGCNAAPFQTQYLLK